MHGYPWARLYILCSYLAAVAWLCAGVHFFMKVGSDFRREQGHPQWCEEFRGLMDIGLTANHRAQKVFSAARRNGFNAADQFAAMKATAANGATTEQQKIWLDNAEALHRKLKEELGAALVSEGLSTTEADKELSQWDAEWASAFEQLNTLAEIAAAQKVALDAAAKAQGAQLRRVRLVISAATLFGALFILAAADFLQAIIQIAINTE